MAQEQQFHNKIEIENSVNYQKFNLEPIIEAHIANLWHPT